MHRFTPLDTDNHPCKAENLKLTNRYICNSAGEVFCQTGWEEPSDPSKIDPLSPCPVPICDVHGETCNYGVCEAPDYCACEIGWEGAICDVCIPLPGCQNGNCTEAMECNCRDGWTGGFCEIPFCSDCQNGECAGPEECVCFSGCETGWQGDSCDRCVPYWECPQPDNGIPACINPNDCICTTSGLSDPKGLCGHSELGGEN